MSQPQNSAELSAKLLTARRAVFLIDGANGTAAASGVTALLFPLQPFQVAIAAHQVQRARILGGQVTVDGAHTGAVSLESIGLQAVPDTNQGPHPAVFGKQCSFSGLTALAQQQLFSSDYLDLRVDDWLLFNATAGQGMSTPFRNFNYQVLATFNNSAASGATINVSAILEVEVYQYDNYDLPVPQH